MRSAFGNTGIRRDLGGEYSGQRGDGRRGAAGECHASGGQLEFGRFDSIADRLLSCFFGLFL
jgi:hypothetical protein